MGQRDLNSRTAEVRARSGPLRPGAGPTPRCRPARAAAALRPRAGTLAGAAASAPARRVGAAGAAGGSVQSPGGGARPLRLRLCVCVCVRASPCAAIQMFTRIYGDVLKQAALAPLQLYVVLSAAKIFLLQLCALMQLQF